MCSLLIIWNRFLARGVKMKSTVLKNWLFQVLGGLKYLHSQEEPLIHQDLRFENIYIRANIGQLKIGGLELGFFMKSFHPAEFGGTYIFIFIFIFIWIENYHILMFWIDLGTPGYMALDLAYENFTTKVDIYSFGMCVLEMFTFKVPYEECSTSYRIFAKQLNVR